VKQRLLSTVSGLVQGQGPIDEGDVGADTAEGSKTDRKTKKEREREREEISAYVVFIDATGQRGSWTVDKQQRLIESFRSGLLLAMSSK
jgi:hypothetical protein